VGENSIRAGLFRKMCKLGGTSINVIQPKAVLTERCKLNTGIEVDRLKKVANEQSLHNVVFIPPVRLDEVGACLKSADTLLVNLSAVPYFTYYYAFKNISLDGSWQINIDGS
jgi:hypothetical protein